MMDAMDDLVTWLRAQLDEDERVARAATPGPWTAENEYRSLPGCRCLSCYEEEPYGKAIHEIDAVGEDPSPILKPADAEHIARHDPARVLRDVEAKRRIVDAYRAAFDRRARHPEDLASAGALLEALGIVKLLALPYADRSGYRPEWQPRTR